MRIIINADDCGCSSIVDDHIEEAIKRNKITSTTIMANMDDFDRAVSLYHAYKESVSFGLHMNLTEGVPLLKSQELLEKGFYKEDEQGRVVFNGRGFKKKLLDKGCRDAILNELIAQADKLRDSHIDISHIDSHHHIHTAMFMIPILPKLCSRIRVEKVRNIWNFTPGIISKQLRKGWSFSLKAQNRQMTFTDYFCSFGVFMEKYNAINYRNSSTIELECHPGSEHYVDEEKLLMESSIEELTGGVLINYKLL